MADDTEDVRPTDTSDASTTAADAATAREGRGAEREPAPGTDEGATLSSRGTIQEQLAAGTQLGRYVILELRGEGGMGVVYSAYDPKLDRRVALKLLRRGTSTTDAGARLLREAQLLAKVSHPNVVAVYDCGLLGDLVFVEMELVDGVTLREWAQGREWRAIVDAFVDAGRALEAVHRVGVIHRDFKPANVIVDGDGRVRVLDFGIAFTVDDEDDLALAPAGALAADPYADTRSMDLPPAVRATRKVLDIAKTRQGAATGTPAYMAPEQWKGRALDARADQYAFAVSLYRTLYGVFPFADPSHASMETATTRGPVPDRPSGTKVPAYVHRALARALAFDAADRFPSMGELLVAIEQDPMAKTRRRMAMFLAAALVVSGVVLAVRYESRRDARMCAPTVERLRGVWDEPKQARIKAGILGSGKPGAEGTWSRTKALLDAYAATWLGMRTEACVESQRSPATTKDAAFAARLMCLDWRLQDLRSLTDVLATDADIVHEAVKAAMGLEPLDDCKKPSLQEGLRPPQDVVQRSHFEAVRAKIAEANSRSLAGKYAAAEGVAAEAVAEARAHGLRVAEARALLELAEAQEGAGHYKAQKASLVDALLAAEAGRDDTSAFEASVELAFDPSDERSEKLATGILERIGAPDAFVARLERARAVRARSTFDLVGALAHAERALEVGRKAHGPSHVAVARAELSLGVSYRALARYDEAMEHQERGQEILERLLGPDHPDCASPLVNMGNIDLERGAPDRALARYERAAAIESAALGAEHPRMSTAHNNIAVALQQMGRYEESQSHYAASLAIKERADGAESASYAISLANLAWSTLYLQRSGVPPLARARFEKAIAIYERLKDRDKQYLAGAKQGLVEIALREKRLDDARDIAADALAIVTKAEGPDHPETARALTFAAKVHLARGENESARANAEQALAIFTRKKSADGLGAARARFALARALKATHGDPAAITALVDAVVAFYTKVGNPREAADVTLWRTDPGAWQPSAPR